MTPEEEAAYRRLKRAVEDDAFFEDWFPGLDDVMYEDDHVRDAVRNFRASLIAHAKFPQASKAEEVEQRDREDQEYFPDDRARLAQAVHDRHQLLLENRKWAKAMKELVKCYGDLLGIAESMAGNK